MTLNDTERRNGPYFAFFTEFDSFVSQLRHMVEDRPITSAGYCIPVPVFHFWPKLTLQCGFSAIAELLVLPVTALTCNKKAVMSQWHNVQQINKQVSVSHVTTALQFMQQLVMSLLL